MARIELGDINAAALGEAPAADTFYELGLMYSIGRSVPVDYVTAHKWFNLAAMRGNGDAAPAEPLGRQVELGERVSYLLLEPVKSGNAGGGHRRQRHPAGQLAAGDLHRSVKRPAHRDHCPRR